MHTYFYIFAWIILITAVNALSVLPLYFSLLHAYQSFERMGDFSRMFQIDFAVFAEVQLIPGRTSEGTDCKLFVVDAIKSNYDHDQKMKEGAVLADRLAVKCSNEQKYPVAYLGFGKGGAWRAAEREPITGVWGRSPQRNPEAETLVGGHGGEAPWSWNTFCFWTFNGSRKFAHFWLKFAGKRQKTHLFIKVACKKFSWSGQRGGIALCPPKYATGSILRYNVHLGPTMRTRQRDYVICLDATMSRSWKFYAHVSCEFTKILSNVCANSTKIGLVKCQGVFDQSRIGLAHASRSCCMSRQNQSPKMYYLR